mmetsp:Transcript_17674/g.31161  ORF Transcript_17674/g.31161 Transcript_17674/m.31161 type:complete len:177 (-) Transcript_17674:85-615(-)
MEAEYLWEVYPELNEQREREKERQETIRLLRILEEIDTRDHPRQDEVEYMRVTANGDLVEGGAAHQRGVHTMANLTNNEEFDTLQPMLQPMQQPMQQPVKLEAGRRLRDGFMVRRLVFTEDWPLVLVGLLVALFLGIRLARVVGERKARVARSFDERVEARAQEILEKRNGIRSLV